jgi:rhamnopyranosyl-N-acetylglucosaminyl-diphospho-decaprenol beta-1,3/1,4-galactofuranosyltransferase
MGVIASVLSFNSVETLPRVINGIESQTRPPDRVIIIDNGSDDPTVRYLRQLPPRYEVIYLPENVGLGAGHNTGWREAMKEADCRFIWTLENDSIPPADCLERLMELANQLEEEAVPFGAVRPRQVHPDAPTPPRATEPHISTRLTFNGTLIPRHTVHRIGMIREDFFIDQDDWEFAHRLASAGLPIYVDPRATIFHLGKGRRSSSILRAYYRVRNKTYLRKSIERNPLAVPEALLRSGAAIVRTLIKEDKKRSRIKARVAATRDGLKGDLGKKDYEFLQY